MQKDYFTVQGRVIPIYMLPLLILCCKVNLESASQVLQVFIKKPKKCYFVLTLSKSIRPIPPQWFLNYAKTGHSPKLRTIVQMDLVIIIIIPLTVL